MTMPLMLAFLSFLLVSGTLAVVGYFRYARRVQVYADATAAARVDEPASKCTDPLHKVVVTLQWLGQKVPVSPENSSVTRRLLMACGYRNQNSLTIYFGMRVLLAGLLAIPALILQGSIDNPVTRMVMLLGLPTLGYAAPGLVLDVLVNRRRRLLRLSLPDALDLMVVCVEAGLALDQALGVVSRELGITHREISEELSLVSLEMRAGTRRAEALEHLAQRTGESELRKLVAILIQSDRFGTSMAEALRTHSEFMRIYRRQQTEERANKIGVKMIFPIFFLILPAIMLVALGPALLQLQKHLLPLLRGVDLP